MFLRGLRVLVGMIALTVCAVAQQRAPIEDYIHTTWDTLTRSMLECKSVVDTKVTTAPILYLPAGMETPAAVAAMHAQCGVQIDHLPRPIGKMGDVKPSEFPKNGLLYLPNPYVVPGGRFNEMYGWDTYFILLGLVSDHRVALAKGIVENFFFEIENYGAILNANRTYFLTRSQPPFLSSMIREVYEAEPASGENDAWLAKAYEDAMRDYSLWTSPAHRAGETGLARYVDLGAGPVPEMADDSTYYPDVIRWLLAHPDAGAGYMMDAPDNPTDDQAATLAATSCDVKALKVCAAAHVDGHRLTAAYFRGDRAMRESGFDTSFRFGPFSGSTDQYAPVCLNSLLYKYETDMEHFATLLHRKQDAAMWAKRAVARKAAINRYLWNQTKSMFYDYDFVNKKASDYNYISAFYPLWAHLATPAQAAAMETQLPLFEHDGGLAMSDRASGTQWDLPFGWAPTNWLTIYGLTEYGDTTDALRLAKSFTQTIEQNYRNDGTLREKYNVVSGSANVAVSAGYKMNVIGFGWTNGAYLRLKAMLAAAPAKP
ncbi:trehalase family glycosidase [Granulicella sibirica]|uniref:Trehalase n=1 Tax=Granulicella sibirica TaxID=2479048 RepID=A0A4Q0T723_9BACT|nr:trehalase family glycosidase [Granulicella sibirica]RXH57918.1 Trehalase [Granulicella sibirica]